MLYFVLTTPCPQAGDNVGLLLRGLKRGDVQRGQVSMRDSKLEKKLLIPIFLAKWMYQEIVTIITREYL
jgi:translation elongation factor EF-1alpha